MTQPHTPAPWHVVDERFESEGPLLIHDKSGIVICEIIGESFDEWAEAEREANAQLIAAAPDLLKALQNLVESERAEAADNGLTDDEMEWLEDARRALAKATAA